MVGRDSQTVGWSLAVSVILRCLLKVPPWIFLLFALSDWVERQAVTGTVTFDRLDLDSVSSGWILEGVVILLPETTSCYRNLSVGIHPEVMLPLVESCSIFLDSCCLLGSHLKGKEKGILGAREGWGACEEGGRKEGRETPEGCGNTSFKSCLMPQKFKWVSCGHVTARCGRHKTSEGVLPIWYFATCMHQTFQQMCMLYVVGRTSEKIKLKILLS